MELRRSQPSFLAPSPNTIWKRSQPALLPLMCSPALLYTVYSSFVYSCSYFPRVCPARLKAVLPSSPVEVGPLQKHLVHCSCSENTSYKWIFISYLIQVFTCTQICWNIEKPFIQLIFFPNTVFQLSHTSLKLLSNCEKLNLLLSSYEHMHICMCMYRCLSVNLRTLVIFLKVTQLARPLHSSTVWCHFSFPTPPAVLLLA